MVERRASACGGGVSVCGCGGGIWGGGGRGGTRVRACGRAWR